MVPSEFEYKLKKLNSCLWVDHKNIAYPYLKEYPTCGLYINDRFIMGVPHKWVPEWTVAGADLLKLDRLKRRATLDRMIDYGFIPEGDTVEERLLWRGYRAILASLCRQGIINKEKAEKIFRCEITPNRKEFPRNFIQMEIK